MAARSLGGRRDQREGLDRGTCSFVCLFLRMGEILEAERREPKESGGNWGRGGDGSERFWCLKGEGGACTDLGIWPWFWAEWRWENHAVRRGQITRTLDHGAEGGGRAGGTEKDGPATELPGALPGWCYFQLPSAEPFHGTLESPTMLLQGKIWSTLNIISHLLYSGIKFISKSVQVYSNPGEKMYPFFHAIPQHWWSEARPRTWESTEMSPIYHSQGDSHIHLQ